MHLGERETPVLEKLQILSLHHLTNKCGHSTSKVDYSTAGKVPYSTLAKPPLPRPEPVRRNWIYNTGHDSTEDNVAIEVTALCYGSGDDGGAGGSKSALTTGKG